MPLITLDGSHEEGGGAILRVALALSVATAQPFRIVNIRANRSPPGLKQQHIVGIKALQQWCDAKVTDCHQGSTELLFIPGKANKRELAIDAVTAAPVTLILQSLLPAIAHHGRRTVLTMTGGTDVKWAPPIDYFANVFAKTVKPLMDIKVKVSKRGYFPKGMGKVEIIVQPHREKQPLSLTDRGRLLRIGGQSHASFALEPSNVATRQSQAAQILIKNKLKELGNYPLFIPSQYHDAASPGSGITLWVEYENTAIGADCLGERGTSAEVVGEEAAKRLLGLMEIDGCVDSWMADQLIPYLALFGGELSTTAITPHTKANIHVCEQFLDVEFSTDGNTIKARKKED